MDQIPQNPKAEHEDPHEQYNPVPRVVLGLVVALVIWAIVYIFVAHPDGRAELGDQRPLSTLAPSGATPSTAAVDGGQSFAAKCQACHQANGQGLPGVFPPLAGSSWVTGSPDALLQIVLHGLNGPIEVAGNTFNGSMPAFGEQMSDAELAAVASFIRSEWGNAAAEVTSEDVGSARGRSNGRNTPWNNTGELQGFLADEGKTP
ncbi:cytochrome C oxidase Cbb3 [Hydrogenophaga sp. Root209]|uniref:c-type cytochrome n=1 Tax=Hydrogenophaga sp. Root209 TaxID=1736490 RepID=UPI0006FFABB3|nr:cytochrome c [Hydrogenophaga sp. Root209]KRC04554.1 cytochrome C oxidase Cbb3 [Hydrogenophaga sp. Root209]